MNRPSSMATPSAAFSHGVLAVSPANADPLLFDAEVKAYSTSLRPWTPGFQIETASMSARMPGNAKLTAVPVRTRIGVTRMYRLASLICVGPIFLPRYSGVRPTSRPPTNTAMTASTSIP